MIAPGRHSQGFVRDAITALRYAWSHPSNRGKRARTISRAILFQIRGRLLHRPTVVPCGARSKIVVSPAEGASGLVYANPPEWNEVAVWRRTLKPGDLFVDVGANVGSYTIWAIEAGAHVIAIEPDPAAAEALRRNLALNGYSADVREVALSDAAGTARFTADLGVLNHLVLDDVAADVRTMEVTTLDEILGERAAAGVKVDVEGAEGLVLQGARRALAEQRIALLQLEWNPQAGVNYGQRREDSAALLQELGYELCRPDATGVLAPVDSLAAGWDVFARPAR